MPNLRLCAFADCNKKHFARGWCVNHYHVWRKWGDPAGKPNKTQTRQCETCGRDYEAYASRKNKKFCSLPCYWESLKIEKAIIVRSCRTCGSSPLPRQARFCSDKCRSASPDRLSRTGPLPDDAVERIRELVSYDPITGVIRRLDTGAPYTKKMQKGYIYVGVLGRHLYAHRIAWALHYGEWPKQYIDHINGIKTDNRIANLRDVAPIQNSHNAGARKDNKLGLRGVTKRPEGYQATIKYQGVSYHLGYFSTPENANKARLKKEKELGIFRHPNMKAKRV